MPGNLSKANKKRANKTCKRNSNRIYVIVGEHGEYRRDDDNAGRINSPPDRSRKRQPRLYQTNNTKQNDIENFIKDWEEDGGKLSLKRRTVFKNEYFRLDVQGCYKDDVLNLQIQKKGPRPPRGHTSVAMVLIPSSLAFNQKRLVAEWLLISYKEGREVEFR